MIIAYLIALIPVVLGGILWVVNKRIVISEWLVGAAAGFIVAGIFHLFAVYGMAGDTETWSGRIVKATDHPEWIEEYQVAIYKTVTRSNGKTEQVFDHYETRHRTHWQFWDCNDSLDGEHEISSGFFAEICKSFNDKTTEKPHKSGFDGGDPNIYVAYNKTDFTYPVTALKSFENRVRAAPSVFSFAEVPKDVPVFEYPRNENWRISDRLLGSARHVSIVEWDCMNARLGSQKKVNVILAGYDSADAQLGHYQQAAWVGGKKNDLVLCYGAGWAYVFGWTEQELVKQNLQTILLENKIDDAIIPLIEAEIAANYIIKDWRKFDYILVEPPTWSYVVLVVSMVLTQGAWWFFSWFNEAEKDA